MSQIRLITIAALAAALSFTACSVKTESTNFDFNNITFSTDTPVSVGSNTLQQTLPIALEAWAKEHNTTAADIEKVTVSEVNVVPTDSTNMANIETLVVQIAGGENGLMEIAVANPIKAGENPIKPTIAQETDVTAAFKSGKPLTVVLDVNALADDAKKASFSANFKFNIAIKAK